MAMTGNTFTDFYTEAKTVIKTNPLLSEEDEIRLGKIIQSKESTKANRLAARNQLVNSNLRLIQRVIKKFIEQGHDEDDVLSYAKEGLMIAADRFDPTLGFRFSTFATTAMRNYISRQFTKEQPGNIIKPSAGSNDLKLEVETRILKNPGASDREIMEEMLLDPKLEMTTDKIRQNPKRLEKAVSNRLYRLYDTQATTTITRDHGSEDGGFTPNQIQNHSPQTRHLHTREETQALERFEYLKNKLKPISKELYKNKPRERDIMNSRVISDENLKTLKELGQAHGVTKERVRQIETDIKRRLKANLTREEELSDLDLHMIQIILDKKVK